MTEGLSARARQGFRLLRALLTGQAYLIPYRYKKKDEPPLRYKAIEKIFLTQDEDMRNHYRLLQEYSSLLDTIASDAPAPLPRWNQDWFPALDAAIYYALISHYRPAQIVEIGSGHSTRFAAQAIQVGGWDCRLTAIDPAPRANLSALGHRVNWRRHRLQETDNSLWQEMREGDFLFIDSSHILMPGTDLDMLLNTILPSLPPGIFIHFHDIFLPDPYPSSWEWRGYNEQQAIAGLLATSDYRVIFSSRHALNHSYEKAHGNLSNRFARASNALASSLWLKKSPS